MTKEFVSYEHSVALKELGLKDKCIATVENNGYVHIKGTRGLPSAAAVVNKVDAPLKQQVFRWFREKYNLHSYIKYEFRDVKFYYDYTIEGYESDINYDTYEEAENALINELISIAKRKIK